MLLLDVCRRPHNFVEEHTPKYICNSYDNDREDDSSTITVVSYNIEKGKNIVEAIELISSDSTLVTADVFLLQEMDEIGTRTIANALGLNYIYFPINSNYSKTKDFGSSILTRDTIIGEHKLILPHGQTHNNRHRGITFAKILVNCNEVLLGSAHLSTVFMPTKKRKEQVTAMANFLNESTNSDLISIVGGDFNALRSDYRQYILNEMGNVGYNASTQGLGSTHSGKIPFVKPEFDMIFARNLDLRAKGKVIDNNVSDHYPIWAKFELNI